jgi:NTP pyrophosphatase (non-canonical NTP hydrolase)
MTSATSDGRGIADNAPPVEVSATSVFAQLITAAQAHRRQSDPFRRLAGLLTASAVLAEHAGLAEHSRAEPGGGAEFAPGALARALADLLRVAAAMAADFDITDLLVEAIRSRYLGTLDASGGTGTSPAPVFPESGDNDEFWLLAATARQLTARYPAETGPYRRLAKIYEEGGEVAEQIHIYAGSGIKRQKHGPFRPARLADELSDLMRSAVAMANDFKIVALLADALGGTPAERTQARRTD